MNIFANEISWNSFILINLPCVFYYFVLWSTNAQLFHKFCTPTCLDTIKNSWNSVMYFRMMIGDPVVEIFIYELEKIRVLKSTVWLCLR
jgi:hypothetical protein